MKQYINEFKTKILKSKLFIAFSVLIFVLTGISLFNYSAPKEDKLYADLFNKSYRIFSVPLPDKLDFCGEPVPLNSFDVRERLDREMLVNVFWQSQTIMLHKRAARWFPVIEPILKRNGVPDDFKYLSLIESGFQNVISPSDAVGFWQFLEETGKKNGLEVSIEVDERYSVEKSTEAACKYIVESKQKLGSWTVAAASYNMGVTGIKRQIDYQENSNYYDLMLNNETSRYLFRILAIKEIMKHPKKYGFYLRKADLYPPIKTYKVQVDTTVSDWVVFAKSQNVSFKILKIFNPWIREKQLTNKTKKSYQVELPMPGYDDYEHLLAESEVRSSDTAYVIDYEEMLRDSGREFNSNPRIHKVALGETVESIAKKYDCDAAIIRSKNKLKETEQPKVDSEIIVGC